MFRPKTQLFFQRGPQHGTDIVHTHTFTRIDSLSLLAADIAGLFSELLRVAQTNARSSCAPPPGGRRRSVRLRAPLRPSRPFVFVLFWLSTQVFAPAWRRWSSSREEREHNFSMLLS